MKTAYGVALTNSVRKTEDPRDIVNYSVFIDRTIYYVGDGQYVKESQSYLARPMTENCAKALAEKLKGKAQEVRVFELLTDDEQYLPETLEELDAPKDPLEITLLKDAVEYSLKSGMPPTEVLEICKSELRGEARLRAVVQGCRVKRIKAGDILVAVLAAVQAISKKEQTPA